MGNLKENKNCYATPEQREVLLHLLTHPSVEQNFFLTGGTALSVFYLNHRKSNDIEKKENDRKLFDSAALWLKKALQEHGVHP